MKKSFNRSIARFLAATVAVLAISFGVSTIANGGSHKDIVDTAMETGSFHTLGKALHAAGLVETLKGEGPFTVFAPTDEAFERLPAGTLEDLLKPENKEKLTAILTYHVVPSKVMASEVANMDSAETVNGQSLTISKNGESVMVDNAQIVQTDIICSNGVIHVIDNVVLPK